MNKLLSFIRRSAVIIAFYSVYILSCGSMATAQTAWTLRNSPPGGGDLLWSVTDGNQGLVAVGDHGKILHSTDGQTWTIAPSGTNVWLVAVTFGNGRYIAVGDNGTVLSSTDGVAWTRITQTGTSARLNNVLYAQKRFVAVGEGGTIVVSDTGDQWSPTTSGVAGWLHGLAFGNGFWMAVGQAGAVTLSKDGLVWMNKTSNFTKDLEAVAYIGANFLNSDQATLPTTLINFIAVGQDGAGVTCTISDTNPPGSAVLSPLRTTLFISPIYTGTSVRLASLAVYNNVFIATGDNGTVITANDPKGPWKKLILGSKKLLNASGFGQSSLFLVGEGETVYQSEPIFPSRLGNISTRGLVGSGGNVMIAGTIVDGAKPKHFLVRAVGPKLTSYGLVGVIPDPVLAVFDHEGRIIATNTGWGTNLNPLSIASAAKQVGAFDLDPNSKDSALVITLNPGIYTYMVSSASGSGGVGLVEAYDMDPLTSDGTRAINISTRGLVGTDEQIMIAGFIVQGPSSKTLLIRGVGPTLANFNVPGTLSDPVIKVIQSDGTVIATNDNWSDPTNVGGHEVTSDEIRGAASQVGAFALTESSKDAAILITVVPGSYTVHVTGKNNTTGVALAEVYEVLSVH